MEFACSPRFHVGFIQVLQLFPTVRTQGFDFTSILCVVESVNGCLSLNVRLVTS